MTRLQTSLLSLYTLSRFVTAFLPRQSSFNCMAAVTIHSDFGAQENSLSLFPLFPHLYAMKWWDHMPWSEFSESWVLTELFHSPFFTFIKRFFSSSSLSAIRVVSPAYQAGDISPGNLDSSLWFIQPGFSHDVCELNKQWQYTAWHSPFPILNWSVSNCCFLTCIQVSQETGKVV